MRIPKLEPEVGSLQAEGLIHIRMRRILSMARRAIEAAKIAFGLTDRTTEHLPPRRTITPTPEIAREHWSAGKLPSFSARHGKLDGESMDLTRICEAIGLDVKDVTGETAPHAASPREDHDRSHEVSDDVLKLVKHIEAVNGPRPALRPPVGEALLEATRPVGWSRAGSPNSANRESAQLPAFREGDIADLLASLKLRLLKIRLPADDMAEIQAEIATATAQLLSPKPKMQIIAISLTTLLAILEKAGPAALTDDIEASLVKLHAFLQQ